MGLHDAVRMLLVNSERTILLAINPYSFNILFVFLHFVHYHLVLNKHLNTLFFFLSRGCSFFKSHTNIEGLPLYISSLLV